RMQPAAAGGKPSLSNQTGGIKGTGVTMDRLAEWLSRRIGAPVLNETHTTGAFDFVLQFPSIGKVDPSGAELPPIFTSLREQLGIRLEPRKVTLEMIVVESAEKATEN